MVPLGLSCANLFIRYPLEEEKLSVLHTEQKKPSVASLGLFCADLFIRYRLRLYRVNLRKKVHRNLKIFEKFF